MSSRLEIKLPDEVMEKLPAGKSELVTFLSRLVDDEIADYEQDFQRRVQGVMGASLSRYEKSMLKDFILDRVLGKELRKHLEEPTQPQPFSVPREAVP
jgi:hypothetical protein